MNSNNFLYDRTYEYYYKKIKITSIDGNVMNMSLRITEGKYSEINTDKYSFHGYYIIKFYSIPYNLQEDLSIYGQVISSGKFYLKVLIYF